jgi:hypothetical protein
MTKPVPSDKREWQPYNLPIAGIRLCRVVRNFNLNILGVKTCNLSEKGKIPIMNVQFYEIWAAFKF